MEKYKSGIRMFSAVIAGMALFAGSPASATLVIGTPTPTGLPANPSPLFGTLISFDDGTTNSALAANAYAGLGVTSITNTLGPQLGYYPSSQSGTNYIGTGFSNNWNADILVLFANLQAAVGIGIAGPTTLSFQLLDASLNVLEGYNLATTPSNTYYYINRPTADVSYLRVTGNFVAIDDLQFATNTVPTPDVPEPGTWAMMLVGFGAIGAGLRRRKRQHTATVTA